MEHLRHACSRISVPDIVTPSKSMRTDSCQHFPAYILVDLLVRKVWNLLPREVEVPKDPVLSSALQRMYGFSRPLRQLVRIAIRRKDWRWPRLDLPEIRLYPASFDNLAFE